MTSGYRVLKEVADLPDGIDGMIEETLEWFADEPRLIGEEFIDKLCEVHGGDEWDVENYYDPAACEILKRARSMRNAA